MRLYHSHVEPLNIVGNVRHIKVFKVSYKDIWVWKAVVCPIGLELSLKASGDKRWKFIEISFS